MREDLYIYSRKDFDLHIQSLYEFVVPTWILDCVSNGDIDYDE